MAFAYVLIKCKSSFENQIIENLIQIKEVKDVKGIFGEYDIFVKLESDSQQKIEEVITNKIRKIPNITTTNSLTPTTSDD